MVHKPRKFQSEIRRRRSRKDVGQSLGVESASSSLASVGSLRTLQLR